MPKPKSNSFEDRRDSLRAERIITARHRLVKHQNRKTDSIWQIAATQNMSLSGLLFASALDYHVGDVIELQVVASGLIDIFNGYGKVIRSSRTKGDHYHVAVQYVDLKSKRSRSAKTILLLND